MSSQSDNENLTKRVELSLQKFDSGFDKLIKNMNFAIPKIIMPKIDFGFDKLIKDIHIPKFDFKFVENITIAMQEFDRSIVNLIDKLMPTRTFDILNRISKAFPSMNDSLQQLEKLSSKTELDESDKQQAEALGGFALETTYSKDIPIRVRKSIIVAFLQKLWKFLGKGQVQLLMAILFFCFQTFNVPQQIIIRETIQEIIVIEKEYPTLILRGIKRNNSRLYRHPNTKSLVEFVLDCGDIVMVLETRKEWIKVRLYNTDIEGWMLKKYTKKADKKMDN